MGTKLLIPLEATARLAFECFGEPEGYQKKPPNRWAATFLIPADNAFKALVDKALKELANEKWGKKGDKYYEEIIADKKACCWVDGNKRDYNGFAGNFALTSYRYEKDGRPLIIDNDGSPLYKSDNTLVEGKGGRLFGGCFVRGEVELWAQDNDNGRGLRAGLLQVQRVKKGDAFGGASAPTAGSLGALADDDEDDLDGDGDLG